MKASNVINAAVLFMAAIYPAKVLVGRTMYAVRAYGEEQVAYERDAFKNRMCETSHEVHSVLGDECVAMRHAVKRWPVVRTAERVADSVHSCGDHACSDLVLYMVNSWAGLAFICTGVVSVAWYVANASAVQMAVNAVSSARRAKRTPDYAPAPPPRGRVQEIRDEDDDVIVANAMPPLRKRALPQAPPPGQQGFRRAGKHFSWGDETPVVVTAADGSNTLKFFSASGAQ